MTFPAYIAPEFKRAPLPARRPAGACRKEGFPISFNIFTYPNFFLFGMFDHYRKTVL